MDHDAFERFERSRSGWSIPLILFLLGAAATSLAIDTVMGVAIIESERQEQAAGAERANGPVEAAGVPDDSAQAPGNPDAAPKHPATGAENK